MAEKYINVKTSPLYKSSTGNSRLQNLVFIFGDGINTEGQAENGRVPATFRGRKGFVDGEDLTDKPALEMYFIDVGQGDSTFIVTPNRKKS